MKVLVISKYTTIPVLAKLPSRWYYLGKELKSFGVNVDIIVGSYNHLNARTVNKFDLLELPGFYVVRSTTYSRTSSIRRVLSWFVFEMGVLKFLFVGRRKYDVVIASSLSLFSIMSALIYKLFNRNVKVVFEIRDIWPLTLIEESDISRCHPLVLLMSVVEWLGIKYSDLCVGTMPGLKDYIEKRFPQTPSRVFISPLGYDSHSNESIRSNTVKFVKRENSDFIIGYAGSIGTTNALDTFVQSIILSGNLGLPFRFILYGEGDLLVKYMDMLKGFSNVEFYSKLPYNQIRERMLSCDILYLSTHNSGIWQYGQSMNKVIDYMLVGRPIIATYSGLESMINESGCGEFVVDKGPEDLLETFIRYSKLSQNELAVIGAAGISWLIKNRKYSILAQNYFQELKLLSK